MATYRPSGDRLGRHRVITPAGALPQGATRVDNSLPLYDNELLIDVATLNIDSASFRQMKVANPGSLAAIGEQVLKNVAAMGKQQNPVTGSGGMLLGTVADLGPKYSNLAKLKVGDPVCTLVSLTLTPLRIEKITKVHEAEQIDIVGQAVLFDSGVLAKLPADLDRKVCLALLDVAGAPLQADRLAQQGQTVYIMGAGKSGMLCAAAIRAKLGAACRILVSDNRAESLEGFKALQLADEHFLGNALNPGETMDKVAALTGGKMVDLVINTANVEGTEVSSVLACRQGGKVYFFNMATNFQKAALGAEGVAMDVEMIVGNGYAPGHADFTLDLYRKSPAVKKWFDQKFAGQAL
jgi:L-erythro-3,5-diaminohexanoate dehydrogenase